MYVVSFFSLLLTGSSDERFVRVLDGAQPAATCPSLFGSARQAGDNRRRRKKLLHEAVQSEHSIDIRYTEEPQEPSRLGLRGIALLGADDGDRGMGVAVVDLAVELAERAKCAPGRYALRVDDKIGRKNVVLAVFNDVVLVKRGKQFRYLQTMGAAEPVFRLIWDSGIMLPRRPVARPTPAQPQRPQPRK